jgi:hypothetical protein
MNNIGCPLFVHMIDGVELSSDDDQVLTKERLSIEKPCVNERPRVGQRPRVDARLTNPNCTQMMQYCGLDQMVEGVASCACANGGILPSSWSKYRFGIESIRRSLQPQWSGLVGRRAVDAHEIQQEVRFLRRMFLRDQTSEKVYERPLHQPVREISNFAIPCKEAAYLSQNCHAYSHSS